MNEAMFNLGILFILAQGVRDPLKSAMLDHIFRVIHNIEEGRNAMKNTVSIKTTDGARTDVKDFDIDKAFEEVDKYNGLWLEIPLDNGGFKLISIDQIVAITVKNNDN